MFLFYTGHIFFCMFQTNTNKKRNRSFDHLTQNGGQGINMANYVENHQSQDNFLSRYDDDLRTK